jgi:hypothetical protein
MFLQKSMLVAAVALVGVSAGLTSAQSERLKMATSVDGTSGALFDTGRVGTGIESQAELAQVRMPTSRDDRRIGDDER